MYHPADNEALEFIELHNQMAVDMDLSKWELSGGVNFEFPEGTVVDGGGYLVIAADPVALSAHSGIVALGPYLGQLANDGEHLELRDRNERLMNEVDYGDGGFWPVAPDGTGVSLAKLDPDASSDLAENWTSSVVVGGTPGERNFPEVGARAAVDMVPLRSSWNYEASNVFPGANWFTPGFDDSAWLAGDAIFVAGTGQPPSGEVATELPSSASTYYYRTEFEFEGPAQNAELFLNHLWDDGAAVYLNGTEVYRQNMPAGAISHTTLATAAVAQADYSTASIAGHLVNGTNVLAVEVHQAGAADPDMVFALAMGGLVQIREPDIVTPLIEFNDLWRFDAAGTDLGTSWREPGFDDSGFDGGNAGQLAGYWPLDGNANGVVGGDGTITGPAFSDDVPSQIGGGQSLSFGGGNQRVTVPDSPALDFDNAMTISAWVKPVGNVTWDGIVAKNPSPGSASNHAGNYELRIENGTRVLTFLHQQGGTNDTTSYMSSGTVAEGVWQHVAVTAENGGQVKFYINGAPAGSAALNGFGATNDNPFYIGNRADLTTIPLDGLIDDVAVWNNALTDEQIAGLADRSVLPTDFGAPQNGVYFGGTTQVDGALTELPLGTTTYYFRKSFEFEEVPARSELLLDLVVDDGAVVYLNGQEIYRHNMPAGPVSFATPAASAIGDATPTGTITLPGDALVMGTNVLAVEVHQSTAGGDSDMAFGAQLTAVTTLPLPVEIVEIPLAINETAPAAEFWFELMNTGGGTIDLDGFVVASTSGGEQTLSGEQIGPGQMLVISEADLGFGVTSGDRIFVLSPDRSAVVAAAEVKNTLKGRSPDGTGAFLFPDVATPGTANSFDFETDVVINEIMYHHRPRFAEAGIPATFDVTELLALDDQWRYNDTGEELPTGWQESAHAVGGNWSEGPGLIGYQSFDFVLPPPKLGTTLADPRTVTPQVTTFYFELDFDITADDLADVDHLELEHVIDDGAIFYLNGREVHRINMPSGAVTSSTLASQQVSLSSRVSDPFTISTDALTVGHNRLSVEVHQYSTDSDDIMFGARLSVARETDPGKVEIPYLEISEEWIELYNRGSSAVDLSGWKLEDAVELDFPAGTQIAPGEYLVIARDREALAAKYPGIDILGEDYSGELGNTTDRIRLVDVFGNPADVVQYYEDGRWPEAADGGGSSLELRNPLADNSVGEAWSASDETDRSPWRTYTYSGTATSSAVGSDNQWREFVLGMLDAGEVLLDDISVVAVATGTELISNGTFDAGPLGPDAEGWRFLGNHRHSEVITDPDDPSNQVLRFVATSATEHMHNHVETTLNQAVSNGQEYVISYRAKWIQGSPQLHSRLYFNRLARETIIEQPDLSGTPGTQNSTFAANIGPTYANFVHSPAVPEANQPITVSVRADDPDGVSAMTIWYSVQGGPWSSVPMTDTGDGNYVGVIPGQPAASIVQFYVEGVDGHAANPATSTFPQNGRDSRALFKVNDGLASDTGIQNLRIIVTPDDADWMHTDINLMSNDRIGATVIYNESEIFYDVGVRLSGSQRARPFQPRLSFALRFNQDQLFRGVHAGVTLDRSDSTGFGQREILLHHAMGHTAGLPAEYNDLVNIITPRLEHTGGAEMQLARYSDIYLDSQYENGGDGRLYEYELVYYPTTANAEGYKRPQPDSTSGTAIRNLGDDEERYRWTFLIKNNRVQDDFSQLIEWAQVMGTSGTTFNSQIGDVIDVDQWLRASAFAAASGFGDQYGAGSQHNGQFYVRPTDGLMLFFPHDLDAFFNAGNPILPGNEISKVVNASPANQHFYYGYMHDFVTSTYNTDYMEPFAARFKELLPAQGWDSWLAAIGSRASNVLGQINSRVAQVSYGISTPGPIDAGNATSVTIAGTGWVNLRELRLAGTTQPLPTTWVTPSSWSVDVSIESDVREITIEAYDFQGNLVGTDSVDVTTTAVNPVVASLRIAEINYNPAAPSASELLVDPSLNNDDFEFVEVQNVGATAIDLLHVRFNEGIDFTFPSVSLAPGEFAVVVKDLDAFELRYGTSVNVVGEFASGGLNNGGELIGLVDALGENIASFAYGDTDPWPELADGNGGTLQLADVNGTPTSQYGKYYRWRLSTEFGGSPGSAGADRIGVVINEVLARTDPPVTQTDAIELFNSSNAAVNIGGWHLSDAAGNLLKFEIPAGSLLGPGEYIVFDEDDFNASMGMDALDFALSGTSGDDVYLVIPGESGQVASFVDEVHFGASPNEESFGRVPGLARGLAPMTALTLGGENSAPRVGPLVISEINYDPGAPSLAAQQADPDITADDLEFVEIHNPTNAAVDLTDWRIRGGVDFDFDDEMTIAAGETIVVLSFNPNAAENTNRLAAFKAHYGLNGDVPLLGGYAGQLSNTGERVELQRPDTPPVEDPTLIPRLSEDEVFYDNLEPWPSGAAGEGNSLQRTSPTLYGNLAGSWIATSPSPGTANFGGPAGDVTGDGAVDAEDIDAIYDAINTGNDASRFDLNGDESVDQTDVVFLVQAILGTFMGDANLDGQVTAADLNRVGINWQAVTGVGWAQGDFSGDGRVNAADLNFVGINWLSGAAAAHGLRVPRAPLPAVARRPVAIVDAVFADTRQSRATIRERLTPDWADVHDRPDLTHRSKASLPRPFKQRRHSVDAIVQHPTAEQLEDVDAVFAQLLTTVSSD